MGRPSGDVNKSELHFVPGGATGNTIMQNTMQRINVILLLAGFIPKLAA
jgi:hypothetical protein